VYFAEFTGANSVTYDTAKSAWSSTRLPGIAPSAGAVWGLSTTAIWSVGGKGQDDGKGSPVVGSGGAAIWMYDGTKWADVNN
jgi:hypothetical protein